MEGASQPTRLSRRTLILIVLLIGLGLGLAVVIILLPPREQAIAKYGLSILGYLFGSIASGAAAALYYLERRRLTAHLLALLTVILLLGMAATCNDLRLFLNRAP